MVLIVPYFDVRANARANAGQASNCRVVTDKNNTYS